MLEYTDISNTKCVISAQIWNFSVFVFSCIWTEHGGLQSEYRGKRPRKVLYSNIFHAVQFVRTHTKFIFITHAPCICKLDI